MNRLRRAASDAAPDVLVLAGLGLVAYGAFLLSPPFGPIVLGLGLIAAVRLGTR